MQPFEEYLISHNLEALAVSVKAKVRYMTVYNAMKGHSITPEHARKIKEAVFLLTGVAYIGPLVLTESKPIEEIQTIAVRKIVRK